MWYNVGIIDEPEKAVACHACAWTLLENVMYGIVTPGSAIYRCCHGTERLAEIVCAVRCLKK